MKILIAEDDPVSRRLLEAALLKWGYEVIVTSNGKEAWEAIQAPDPPLLLILDWLMPEMDGIEICREARLHPSLQSAYIILLTSRGSKDDIIKGLEAGADDYVTKPFDHGELRARLRVGSRVVQLQTALGERVHELEEAMTSVKQLQGLLPICCYCKKIRDDGNYWHRVESYIANHANVRFSHGICPDCSEKIKADLNLG
ncbi:MAG TPA: response regulator transcription factor [Methylomirabilota bacterium]|nr:response regulator transcription factor [Methylomirabilota bacterium]